jgi:putative transposase
LESYEDVLYYKVTCTTLDEEFENAFPYSSAGGKNPRLRSTNLTERLNAELRRREQVIRIFPNIASANRLIGALLMDQSEEWESSVRMYIIT